jgi:TRAP-type C4-dicarboxylate transport system permease small subunit
VSGGGSARVARLAGRVLGIGAGALLLAMTALTVADVLGRYLLARPIPGAFELTQIMLALLIFLGLPLVSARDGHVAVSLLDRRLGPRAAGVRDRAVAALGALVCGVIAWRLAVLAERLTDYGDVFEFIGLPRAAATWPMSALAALAALVLLAKAVGVKGR